MDKQQQGFGVISALLGLVIAAVVTMGVIQGKSAETQVNAGRLEGDLINQIKEAVNAYTMENYPALQSDLPVSKTVLGVPITLASGTAPGQSMAPTIDNLVAMGYLSAGTRSTASLGGSYQVQLRKEPAGCVGLACNIPGTLYIDQAVTRLGSSEMRGVTVGSLMQRVGGDVLVSLNTNPAVLTAMNGADVPNPLPGTPAGVVGARVGFGASGFGRFLVMNDPRDPNFQGKVTVAQDIHSTAGSVSAGSGTGTAGTCSLGAILNSGQIVSRAIDCITRVWMDGSTGQIGAADIAGTPRVLLDGGTGGINSMDATGAVRTSIGFDGAGESQITTDNLANNAGTAGLRSNGNLYSTSLDTNEANMANASLAAVNPVGSACPREGGMSWSTTGGSYGMVRCTAGVWQATTAMAEGTVGAPCAVNGAVAVSPAGELLICNNNQWTNLLDRVGRMVLASSYMVRHGDVVPAPVCANGAVDSTIYLIPNNEEQATQYVNRFATRDAATGGWTVSIYNGKLQALTSDLMVAQVYCVH